MKNLIKNTIMLAVVTGLAFFFQTQIRSSFELIKNYYFPCQDPISYNIGSFDNRFGFSKNDFLKALNEAEMIWEGPVNKELFVYEPEISTNSKSKNRVDLKINLIFDIRQEATNTLREMGLNIKNNQKTYNNLKKKYDSLQKEFLAEKNSFEYKISVFETRQNTYNNNVLFWNKKGGAPKEEFLKLEKERISLDKEFNDINKKEAQLNNKAKEINALAMVLNDMIKSLNLNVRKFNETGDKYSGEFKEGIYESSPDGNRINIYQFANREKLVRVLAHELGHALGLDHIENPKAIMYRLNDGMNTSLTEDDIVILKAKCEIQ